MVADPGGPEETRLAPGTRRRADEIPCRKGGHGYRWARGGLRPARGQLLGQHAEPGGERGRYPSAMGCAHYYPGGTNHANRVDQPERQWRRARRASLARKAPPLWA